MLCCVFAIASAGCNQSINAPAGSTSSGGGFTLSLDGFTLQFSDEWQKSPAVPGNPAVAAMLGRTPQEAVENGATFVALAPPIPNGSDASSLMGLVRKPTDNAFMKTEQDQDIQISGMSGFFQVVRTFGNSNASENLREDTLQHKWTLKSGNRIIQIAGQCRASKAPEFAPKFEEVVQTLKFQ